MYKPHYRIITYTCVCKTVMEKIFWDTLTVPVMFLDILWFTLAVIMDLQLENNGKLFHTESLDK